MPDKHPCTQATYPVVVHLLRLGVGVAAVVDETRCVALLRGVDDGVRLQRHEVVVVVLEPVILLRATLKLLRVQHLRTRHVAESEQKHRAIIIQPA